MQLSSFVGKEVQSLRKDTTRLLGDLDNLQKRLSRMGKKAGVRLVDDVSERFNDNVGTVSTQLSRAGDQAGRYGKRYLKTVDSSVRAKPYYFLLGAAAAGLVFGIIAPALRKRA